MKNISVVSIPVSDQQAAKTFYLQLGFEVITEAPMGDGNTWIQLGFPGAATSVSLVNWFDYMAPGSMHGLVITTEDIEKEVAELTAKGITVSKIDNTPWGRFANIKDPDNNGLIFHQL
jgi:catechol 2,3-dioxygenase-like lactoylglutathione lyase family enzyme